MGVVKRWRPVIDAESGFCGIGPGHLFGLVAVILAVFASGGVTTADASSGALESVREWGGATRTALVRDPSGRVVERRLAVLRRSVTRAARRLRAIHGTDRRDELLRTGRALDRSLAGLATRLHGDARYAFFLAYQAELERLAVDAGLASAPTGRLLGPAVGGTATPDADGDGHVDMADGDADGDGVPNGLDASDRGWGVPDAFQARATTAVPADAYRRGYCIWLTEDIPSPTTIAAASRLRQRAALRGCAPAPVSRATAARAAKTLSLKKAGIAPSGARVEGTKLTLAVKTKKTVKIKLDVVSGTRVVAGAKRLQVKGSQRPNAKQITATLDRAPSGSGLKLRLTAQVGKKVARGTIALKLIAPPAPVPGIPGLPLPSAPCTPGADADGDTIPDCQEIRGYEFKYYLPAAQCTGIGGAFTCLLPKTRVVTSDPSKANTDADAVTVDGTTFQLTDADEWRLNVSGGLSDPSSKDSDADGLPDTEELLRWGTLASSPDSDGDSGDPKAPGIPPNAELFDKAEVDGGLTPGGRVQTSPTASDTDGDGLSDLNEILNGTINPVIADVPTVSINPKDNTTFLVTLPTESSASNSYELGTGTENATDTSDERVDQTVTSERNKFSAELEGSVSKKSGGDDKGTTASASLKVGYEGEWATEKTTGHTVRFDTSSRTSQERRFEQTAEQSFKPFGTLSATFALKNESDDFTVNVEEIEVSASFLCVPSNGPGGETGCGQAGRLVDIPVPLKTAGGFSISAASSVERTLSTPQGADASVPRELLKALLANPNAVTFSVSKIVLRRSGDTGTVEELLDSSVRQSTASVTIDDGAGSVRTLSVAAGVGRAWGAPNAAQALPKPIGTILDEAGVPFVTGPGLNPDTLAADRTVLRSLNGKQAQPYTADTKINGAWLVLANADGFSEKDFNATALTVKDTILLAYVKDADGDGLFDRDERLLATSDTLLDTDGDGAKASQPCAQAQQGCLADSTFASDWFESQVGWSAGPTTGTAAYNVRSNPATCDGDGDGSPDGPSGSCSGVADMSKTEILRKTDPNNPNTDGDLDDVGQPWLDAADPAPLVPNSDKGPVNGSWAPASLLGNGGNQVFANGTEVQTPPFTLCQDAQTPGPCQGATGYYRVTWVLSTFWDQSSGAQPVGRFGRFRVTADRPGTTTPEVLLESDTQPWFFTKAFTLYFKAGAALKNVRLSFRRDVADPAGNPVRMGVIDLALNPVTSAQFFTAAGTAAGANSTFQAIAFPGRMLLPAANAASVPDSSQSAVVNTSVSGAGFAPRTVELPVTFTLPGTGADRRYVDEMARFRLSMPTGTAPSLDADSPLANVALVSGSGSPPGMAGFDSRYVGATNSSLPLTEGHVYVGDVSADGNAVNVLAKTTRGNDPVKPVLYAPGSTGGLRLDHVVLQRLGSARDWVGRSSEFGNVTNQPDGPWSGFGMHGMSPEIHTSGGGGQPPSDPGTALMPQSSNWPADLYTGVTIDPTGTNYLQTYPDFVPVTPRSGFDRPTWNLVMKPDGASRCATDGAAFKEPFYVSIYVHGHGSLPITSSWLPYIKRLGQNTFPGTDTTVVHPPTEQTMGQTQPTTSFGYYVPPCPIGGSLSKLGLVQAIVLNHPSG